MPDPIIRIEDWAPLTVMVGDDQCAATLLLGQVYGHPRFRDGYVLTIQCIRLAPDGLFEDPHGRRYELGEPCAQVKETTPNWRDLYLEKVRLIREKMQ